MSGPGADKQPRHTVNHMKQTTLTAPTDSTTTDLFDLDAQVTPIADVSGAMATPECTSNGCTQGGENDGED
ncbi:hypothetical protein GCM10009550_71630 [Actinocorallia libanotica]|uniref:FxLD family lantipeptide n=2 Tax=Actinocorallia libanotica TaxID=46162 RepID=A0ABN1RY42_9ACTN